MSRRVSRERLLVLAATSACGCFSKPDVDVDKLQCATDKNCPTGYVCVDPKGSPPLGSCAPVGGQTGVDAPAALDGKPGTLAEVASAPADATSDVPSQGRETSASEATIGGAGGAGAGGAGAGGAGTGGIGGTGGVVATGGTTSSGGGGTHTGGTTGADGQGGQGDAAIRDVAVLDDLAGRDIAPDRGADAVLGIAPPIGSFPAVAVGGEATAIAFTVSNTGDVAAGVLETSIEGAAYARSADNCRGLPLPGRSSCVVAVTFRPTSAGDHAGTLRVSGTPGGSVSAILSGTAIAPGELTIQPSSSAFANTVVGQSSAPTTFTILNTGGTAAGVNSALRVALSGGDSAEFKLTTSTCGSTLASGGACYVTVLFSPASLGAKTISLSASASPGGAAVASLSGVALSRCSLAADGLCPPECSSVDDVDCKQPDGTSCSSATQCRSGSCVFSTCCGQTLTCPNCASSTDCTADPTMPICLSGTCSPCQNDDVCRQKSASFPVCDATGACIATPPLTWSRLGTGLSGVTVIRLVASGSNLFAATSVGVHLSTDAGVSWTPVNNGLPTGDPLRTHSLLVTGGYLFAGTDGAGVFRSSNNGTTWSAVNTGLPSASQTVRALGTNGSYVLASLSVGQSARTADFGDTWEMLKTFSSGGNPSSVEAFLTVGSNLYAATFGSGVWSSPDRGATWTDISGGLSSDPWGYSLLATSGYIFMGTGKGHVFRLPIGGSTWTLTSAGLPSIGAAPNVGSMVETGGNLYACQVENGVFMSSDEGLSWQAVNHGLPVGVNTMVLLVNGNDILVGTHEAGVYRSALPL